MVGRIFEKIDEKTQLGFVPYGGEGDLSEDKLKSCLECLAQVFNSKMPNCRLNRIWKEKHKLILFPSFTELGWRSNFTREELTR